MKKTVLFLLILLPLLSSVKANEWEIIGSMPVPVKGAQAVVHDTTIYIFGGFSDSLLTGTKLIQAYYPNSNKWKILDDSLIVPRYELAAHAYNGETYIFGGATTSNDSSYAIEKRESSGKQVIHKYDYNFNRKFSTSVVAGDYLYIFGGFPDFQLFDSLSYCVQFHIPSGEVVDTFNINDIYGYDLPSVQMSAVANGQIYVFGGVFNGILREVSTFGLDNKQWKSEPTSLKEKRAGGVAITIENYDQIVLVGGFNEINPEAMNSVEIYNYLEGSVERSNPLNIERAECAAVLYNESVYVFGGKNENDDIVEFIEKTDLPFSPVTAIGETDKAQLISDFENIRNYPNPFNPSTNISFKLNTPSKVKINIFDVAGNFVISLANKMLKPGSYKFNWDGKNSSKTNVSSGIYFYQISTANQVETKRMILIR
ncbi:MAG: T9SS type A sorting domain-containing protein [Calditrichaeota bacterium]|nr:T9SS type A sorting domain-containing protein [Calditrichota bacterium]